MVDFQSRTTRRDRESDENEEEPVEEAGEGGDETEDEAPSETEAVDDAAPVDPASLAFAVVTITSERTISEDAQGDVVVEAIEADAGVVTTRELVAPEIETIRETVSTLVDRADVDAVVTIGGTGVEPDDVTVEALSPLFDKRLQGFGELFRLLAHDDAGSGVVGTRTTAGIVGAVPVFALPGTITGALLATDEIVIPEAGALAVDANPSAE